MIAEVENSAPSSNIKVSFGEVLDLEELIQVINCFFESQETRIDNIISAHALKDQLKYLNMLQTETSSARKHINKILQNARDGFLLHLLQDSHVKKDIINSNFTNREFVTPASKSSYFKNGFSNPDGNISTNQHLTDEFILSDISLQNLNGAIVKIENDPGKKDHDFIKGSQFVADSVKPFEFKSKNKSLLKSNMIIPDYFRSTFKDDNEKMKLIQEQLSVIEKVFGAAINEESLDNQKYEEEIVLNKNYLMKRFIKKTGIKKNSLKEIEKNILSSLDTFGQECSELKQMIEIKFSPKKIKVEPKIEKNSIAKINLLVIDDDDIESVGTPMIKNNPKTQNNIPKKTHHATSVIDCPVGDNNKNKKKAIDSIALEKLEYIYAKEGCWKNSGRKKKNKSQQSLKQINLNNSFKYKFDLRPHQV